MESPRYKKLILDRFQEHVRQDYENYCSLHGLDRANDHQLLTFLIDHELIPSTHIQRYTVRQEFERVYPLQDFHKTHTVLTLAHRFSIPERTVWSILKGVRGRKRGR